MKMYIAVLDEFPVYMTPTLVAHAVLRHNEEQTIGPSDKGTPYQILYEDWITESFKKCVVSVNQKEFDKICSLPNVTVSHENNTLGGKKSCAVIVVGEEIPNVLKFARLWNPKV